VIGTIAPFHDTGDVFAELLPGARIIERRSKSEASAESLDTSTSNQNSRLKIPVTVDARNFQRGK
jgi:hypothetical protein